MGFSLNKNVFECFLNQASEVWIDALIFAPPNGGANNMVLLF